MGILRNKTHCDRHGFNLIFKLSTGMKMFRTYMKVAAASLENLSSRFPTRPDTNGAYNHNRRLDACNF